MMKVLFAIVLLAVAHSTLAKSLTRVHSEPSSDRRIVCYYGSWAVYRPDLGKFDVENIDPWLCTHLMYAFAGLNPSTYEIESLDTYNDLYDNYGKGAYQRFTGLTSINPDVKCILSVGGWNEGSEKYSDMANDPTKRSAFVNSVVPFLQKYGFVGLDLDWEYPTQRGGIASDKDAYTELLKELKEALSAAGYLLSIAVSAGKSTIDAAYNVPDIIQYVDFVNVMSYDYHGSWETYTGENAPLYQRPEETGDNVLLNLNFSINYWLQLGAPADKINMGMPTYGHNYALADPNDNGFYATSWGPGTAGPYTRQAGTLGYNEICVDLNDGGWTVVLDSQYYMAPYAYQGNQWIGYDDPNSIVTKCEFANSMNLGGAMVWSIETDDFQPTCSSQVNPILTVINEYIRGIYSNTTRPPTPPPPTTTPYTGPPTTPRPTTTPRTQPTPAPTDVCQHEGFQADPNDCTIFYDCIMSPTGTWEVYEYHCGPGTVFDPSIDSCNYADQVPDCHADI